MMGKSLNSEISRIARMVGKAGFEKFDGLIRLAAAMDLLQQEIRQAQPRPIALLGFSQGCMLAAQFVALHPDQVRAVVCIGGALKLPVSPPPPAAAPPPFRAAEWLWPVRSPI